MNFFKYLFTFFMPWVSMLFIDQNIAAVITFFLQISVVGWIPGAIWACVILKKHLASKKAERKLIQEAAETKRP